MNYKLAKRLKDAGFPQQYGETHRFIYPDGSREMVLTDEESQIKNAAYEPTLEELIEECGPDTCIYYVSPTHSSAWKGPSQIMLSHGQTPREAVAKLWLLRNPQPTATAPSSGVQ